MKGQLLTVKLYTPPLRSGLVARPRLLQKLKTGLQQGSQLSLISAPAGYGKTTLVLEWLAALERSHSWLSLDRGDNYPVLFLAYLIMALQQVDATIGQQQLAELTGPRPASQNGSWLQGELVPLINQLAAVTEPFVLVLDDYHVVDDVAIHEAMAFLLEHQPPQMHLIIATRQDPLLPLSRLRSQGRVTEVRLSDLRFTPQEGATFLNETMALGLKPEELATLEEHTEGWIAGLQLAALSLTQPAAGEDALTKRLPLAAFGDDRHIVDYLMDEVLSRQPARIQRFLLQTSILDRLCAPLCDALLEQEGIAAEGGRSLPELVSPSQRILEELEQKNVFIIPLDSRRYWYRYHHLFGNILYNRLQSADPGGINSLHRRASLWFEGQGRSAEAVDHALLAEDFERALGLIEGAAHADIWASGNLPVLLNWSRRLPEAVLLSRPELCLYYARGLFFAGQVEAAESFLDAAERALRARETAGDGPGSALPPGELWAITFTNRATFAAMRGDAPSALQLAERARPLLPAEDHSTHARLAHAVGMAHYFQGEPGRAAQAFAQAISLADKAGNQILGLDVAGCLALTRLMAGELRAAEQVCRDALAEGSTSQQPAAGAVYLALAELLFEQNRLPEAQETLTRCITLAHKAGWPHILWQAFALQARLRQALGDPDGALEALRAAEQVAERYPLAHVRRFVAACRAELELAGEYAAQAAAWAEERQQPAGGQALDIIGEREQLIRARILLAHGAPAASLAVLDWLLPAAEATGRGRAAVEALLLRALALRATGAAALAVTSMQRAITLAAPEGFARPFLHWHGLAGAVVEMSGLLGQVEHLGLKPGEIRFARQLLNGLDATLREEGAAPPQALPEIAGLVEPLSERELEILALIAQGLSNPEVAERLYLSPNTVRVHTSNIYGKLGVHNRVAAVTRAQSLGLIPVE